jgi:hypothetical protein
LEAPKIEGRIGNRFVRSYNKPKMRNFLNKFHFGDEFPLKKINKNIIMKLRNIDPARMTHTDAQLAGKCSILIEFEQIQSFIA